MKRSLFYLDGKKTARAGAISHAKTAFSRHCFSDMGVARQAAILSSSGTLYSENSKGLCQVIKLSTQLA